jgi:general secretion pathway protein F
MVYPGLLTAVGIGSIFILMNFVVPRFASVFQEGRMECRCPPSSCSKPAASPRPTAGWWASGSPLASFRYLPISATREGRLWWDGFRLRVPLLGDALRKAETARFARAMGTLIANSVPLVQSLNIAGTILNNKKIAAAIEPIALGVKRGEGLSAPGQAGRRLPSLAAHLLSVGEETGRLDQMFLRIADVFEEDPVRHRALHKLI